MIAIMLLDAAKAEASQLERDLRYMTAMRSDEQTDFHLLYSIRAFQSQLDLLELLHIAIIDVAVEGGTKAAQTVRRRFPDVEMMVISEERISPLTYLTPAIRPAALLLRPYGNPEGKKALEEFFMLAAGPLFEKEDSWFWAKTKEGTQKIPFRSILYFEAREKRIFVRTAAREYGTGGTIEKLMEDIPANFLRCHRSYVVNRDYIEWVRISEGTLQLMGGVQLPVSRSYKEGLKEFMGRSNVQRSQGF